MNWLKQNRNCQRKTPETVFQSVWWYPLYPWHMLTKLEQETCIKSTWFAARNLHLWHAFLYKVFLCKFLAANRMQPYSVQLVCTCTNLRQNLMLETSAGFFCTSFLIVRHGYYCVALRSLNQSQHTGQVRSGSRIVRRPLRHSSTVTAVDSLSP